jgi:hypothetical protein
VDDIPLEASPDDVAEQRAEVAPEDEVVPPPAPVPSSLPWDADPADVAEQLAEVPLDDDWA